MLGRSDIAWLRVCAFEKTGRSKLAEMEEIRKVWMDQKMVEHSAWDKPVNKGRLHFRWNGQWRDEGAAELHHYCPREHSRPGPNH